MRACGALLSLQSRSAEGEDGRRNCVGMAFPSLPNMAVRYQSDIGANTRGSVVKRKVRRKSSSMTLCRCHEALPRAELESEMHQLNVSPLTSAQYIKYFKPVNSLAVQYCDYLLYLVECQYVENATNTRIRKIGPIL